LLIKRAPHEKGRAKGQKREKEACSSREKKGFHEDHQLPFVRPWEKLLYIRQPDWRIDVQ